MNADTRSVDSQTVDTQTLTAALSALAGPACVATAALAQVVTDQLHPAERDHIARAISKRQAEFGTARVLARRALADLGVPTQSLVPNADRSPSWPEGVVGSISHSNGWCAVVVARAGSFAGIGLDLETAGALNDDMRAAISTPAELRWLQAHSGPGVAPEMAQGGTWLDALLFSAKESFYKCQYPLTRTFLEFSDVELQFDLEHCSFRAARLSERVPQHERLRQIEGRWLRLPGVLVSLATLVDLGEP